MIVSTMPKITIQPRLQVEKFSLYWKEPLQTETQCLPPLELEVGAEEGATVQDLLAQAAAKLGWQAVETLQRLDGFKEPWERCILKGRELNLQLSLQEQLPKAPGGPEAAGSGGDITLTFVRKVLRADGWKICLADDFMTDSDDEDSDA